MLTNCTDVALDPDGSLYIADYSNHRIRKVTPDGIISTICGNGKTAYVGVHIPSEQYQLWSPKSLAVSPDGVPAAWADIGIVSAIRRGADGSIYLAHSSDNYYQIMQIRPDNMLKYISSKGRGYEGDGGHVLEAKFLSPRSVTPDTNGVLYLCDTGNERIRVITTDGIVNTIAGTGIHGFSGDGEPALQAKLDEPIFIAIGQKGIYIADNYNQRIRYLFNSLSEFVSSNEIAVPAADGSEIFVFDPRGKHLRTLDAFTMKANWTFNYDPSGWLASVVDCYGNSTLIDRDAQGNPIDIVAPGGQKTQITTNEWGYLSSIKLPGNRLYQFISDKGGLIRQTTDPRGGVHKYEYSEQGLLIGDENPEGKRWKIKTTTTSNGYVAAYTSPMDRITTYIVERQGNGDVIMRNISPGRAENIIEAKKEGIQKTTSSSGMIAELETTGDPRFGIAAEIPKTFKITTPGGLQAVYGFNREIVQSNSEDYSTFSSLKDTITFNGQNFIYNLDKTTRKLTRTSAGGRATVIDFDQFGRLTKVKLPNLTKTINYTYDDKRRMIGILTDKADSSFAYYEAGGQCCESELISEYERVPRQGTSQKIKFNYDGDLITQMSYIGAANGLFYYEYDVNFYLVRLKFDNQSGVLIDIPVMRDADGNITVLGDFNFQRTGPGGSLNKISNASMSVDLPFDSNGLPSGLTYKVNSNTIYNLQLTLDSTTAMITKKVETLDGSTQTYDYQYDDNGRLINVTLNGNQFEA